MKLVFTKLETTASEIKVSFDGVNYKPYNVADIKSTGYMFEIPFILIFSRIFGLYGLCFCVACAEFLMSVIALAVLRKLLKKV